MGLARALVCCLFVLTVGDMAFAFPIRFLVIIAVRPWVPTSQQPVIVTISDAASGFIPGVGSAVADVKSTINGSEITIVSTLVGSPGMPDVVTFAVDLGTLPPGRYTVAYSSNDRQNPTAHNASLAFSVSEDGLATAVEYFNASLRHYFITADRSEIEKLDQGTISGWSRTGESFAVMASETMPTTATPVCRFYGAPSAGLDSHFFPPRLPNAKRSSQSGLTSGSWNPPRRSGSPTKAVSEVA